MMTKNSAHLQAEAMKQADTSDFKVDPGLFSPKAKWVSGQEDLIYTFV